MRPYVSMLYAKMYVTGTCLEMCPRKERQLREREGLLHRFESLHLSDGGVNQHSNQRNVSSQRVRKVLPKADISKTVKSFARSAAGLDKMIAEDLRPPHVLIETVAYLCHEVLTQTEAPFNVIYDFIFDRLRSVRQDLVIQRIMDKSAIIILEIIIRFHVYASYRMQDEPIEKFDPHINRKHLVDCLKRLIGFYELNNYWEPSRKEFEALYLIAGLESSDVMFRALFIQPELSDPVFDSVIEVCFAYHSRNYVRYFRLLEKFPPLTASYFTQQARLMRSSAFQVMSTAYGVSTSKVPVKLVTKTLRYPSVRDAANDLRLVLAEIVLDEGDKKIAYARFKKANSTVCLSKMDQLSNQLGGLQLEVLEPINIKYIVSEMICPNINSKPRLYKEIS